MNKHIVRFHTAVLSVRNSADRGAVAAEYGVLIAGIVAVVAAAAILLGGRLGGLFDSVVDSTVAPTTST
jgi:Flp pilus assembly pilin Flp